MIIGKLIPAGTGMGLYRDIKTVAPDYEPLPFYTSEAEEEMDLATWLREASTPRAAEEFGAAGDGEAAPDASAPSEFTDAITALENMDTDNAADQPGDESGGSAAAGD